MVYDVRRDVIRKLKSDFEVIEVNRDWDMQDVVICIEFIKKGKRYFCNYQISGDSGILDCNYKGDDDIY